MRCRRLSHSRTAWPIGVAVVPIGERSSSRGPSSWPAKCRVESPSPPARRRGDSARRRVSPRRDRRASVGVGRCSRVPVDCPVTNGGCCRGCCSRVPDDCPVTKWRVLSGVLFAGACRLSGDEMKCARGSVPECADGPLTWLFVHSRPPRISSPENRQGVAWWSSPACFDDRDVEPPRACRPPDANRQTRPLREPARQAALAGSRANLGRSRLAAFAIDP